MIFGVLNPEKIWHNSLYTCTPHLYTVANLSWKIQKVIFQQYYSFILQVIDAISKENKLLLHYLIHLKNVAPLPCKNCTNSSSFSFFHVYQVPIRYTDELRNGSVLLRYGLNFSRAWWTIQLISGEKDWKDVSVQKVVTFNICCNVACLTFHLPHITTGSFQSHKCQPTTGSFQIHQRSEKCTYLQSDENVVHLTR